MSCHYRKIDELNCVYKLTVAMLSESYNFDCELSEKNYNDIVNILNLLRNLGKDMYYLQTFYRKFGFPETYDPFDIINLRYQYKFGNENVEVENKCKKIYNLLKK